MATIKKLSKVTLLSLAGLLSLFFALWGKFSGQEGEMNLNDLNNEAKNILVKSKVIDVADADVPTDPCEADPLDPSCYGGGGDDTGDSEGGCSCGGSGGANGA